MTDLPDLVSAVVFFYKFDLRFDRWKRTGKVEDHRQLIIGLPSWIERAGLDIALNITTPYVVRSSFGSSILKSTPAFCICYVAIAPTDSGGSLKGSWIYG